MIDNQHAPVRLTAASIMSYTVRAKPEKNLLHGFRPKRIVKPPDCQIFVDLIFQELEFVLPELWAAAYVPYVVCAVQTIPMKSSSTWAGG